MDPSPRRAAWLPRVLATGVVAVTATGIVLAATTTPNEAPRPAAETGAPQPPSAAPATSAVTPSRSAAAKVRPRPARSPRAAVLRARRPLFPLPARPAYPHPCPPPPVPPGPPFKRPKPAVRAADLPRPVRVAAHRHVDLGAVTGKGMWLTTWADTKVDVPTVIARARAAGVHQLWVRTGGTYQGWYGDRLLTRLLPAAHAAGIKVIAWDFPTLSDPLRDVRRARHDLTGRWAGQRLDGFSADLETIYEGTFETPRRVQVYLSRVRVLAGAMPVIATVLRPTPEQLVTYPYRAEAPYVDVFAPMVYWSCNEPGATALSALKPLVRMRPVHLIGQSYNMGPEGGRHGMPTAREIWRFLDVARRAGAVGASLYDYSESRAPQWRALARYPWPAAH
ncbi:MAG: hypothetical protein JO222_06970 [Frankiales bacterium]|nr:hypothetical protein [Frankiales bacterium]